MLRGSVKGTGYPFHSPDFLFTSPPVRHRVPSHFNWTLPELRCTMQEARQGGACYTAGTYDVTDERVETVAAAYYRRLQPG